MSSLEPTVLFDDGEGHRVLRIGHSDGDGSAEPTTGFVFIDADEVGLVDPGSSEVFHRSLAILSRFLDLRDVRWSFFSHQDPDVCSAIPLWSEITSSPVLLPEPWSRFVLHLGDVEHDRLVTIPDPGGTLPLGNGRLTVVPSHFLHSSAAHSLWDPRSRILYSADIGASKFSAGEVPARIGRFSQVVDHLSGYHRRFMAGNRACRAWVRRVRSLGPRMIAPHHGPVLEGEAVAGFLEWFEALWCGADRLEELVSPTS